MEKRTINLRGEEWEAERLVQEIVAAAIDIDQKCEKIKRLTFNLADHTEIYPEIIAQEKSTKKLLGIYKGITAQVLGMIWGVDANEVMRIVKESNGGK